MSASSIDKNQQIIDEFHTHNGTVTTAGFGRNLVLLHHVGAKTGTVRITPVMNVREDANTWFIAASKGGAPQNPQWYHNLLAHRDIEIETPEDGLVPVHVEELHGTQRASAWSKFKEMSPGFQQYEQKTSRVIPVLVLRRRPSLSRV